MLIKTLLGKKFLLIKTNCFSSSAQWMERHLRDKFVKQARYKNYRSRAAFKLIEIDDKYRLFKPGMIVIECGAAPGSWTQVIVERLHLKPPEHHQTGAVISVDLSSFCAVEGAICLPKTNFTSQLSQAKILTALDGRQVDVIVSDMSPNVTGAHDLDHERIISLAYSTIRFAMVCLKNQGTVLLKLFNGRMTDDFTKQMENFFEKVKIVKPKASRDDSTELYVLARYYKKEPLSSST